MSKEIWKLTLVVLALTTTTIAQEQQPDWKRVETGQYSTVDVDALSVVFGADGLVSAKYRTTLAKSESLAGDPSVKYKSRLDTIEFERGGGKYRYAESTLLNSDGKSVLTRTMVPRGEWRRSNRVSTTLYGGLNNSPIFLRWTVVSYHFVGPNSQDGAGDTGELGKLLGSEINLSINSAWAGGKHCGSPGYESRKLTDADLEAQLGIPISRLGMAARPVGVIAMICGAQGWQPSKSLLIPLADGRMLMLWDGVFLELVDRHSKKIPIPLGTWDPNTRTLNVRSQPD
jgi:hypothetical protein